MLEHVYMLLLPVKTTNLIVSTFMLHIAYYFKWAPTKPATTGSLLLLCCSTIITQISSTESTSSITPKWECERNRSRMHYALLIAPIRIFVQCECECELCYNIVNCNVKAISCCPKRMNKVQSLQIKKVLNLSLIVLQDYIKVSTFIFLY